MGVEALIERARRKGWRALDLSDRRLTALPDALWELTALEGLDLSGNELTELPAAIGKLVGLRSLVLGRWDKKKGSRGNQLTQLPAEFAQMTNLTTLSLSDNQLTKLSAEFGQLSKLTYLYLHNNKLSQLPAEFGQLSKLTCLYLHDNKLSQLPAEFGQLSKLTKLSLYNNQLTKLPAEFGQLSNLTKLYLSDNQLTQLPAEFSQLSKLTELDLSDNLLPIPPEILDKYYKPTTILNFYTEYLTGQKKTLNEAKLLVVGQGSVGKTSLVNRLLYNQFNSQENKTEGINIQTWQVGDTQLNVWDFGGQEIMHATHQFFLTKRSLYLLVLDTRLREEENRLEYWLKIIQSFGGDSPVIVVGNKVDQQPLDLDKRGLQIKYSTIKVFVETSCQSGQGINDLKAAITEQINQMEHVKDELPLSWFELKTQIEDMDKDYIPYPEYQQLCQDKGINNKQSQQTLIGFLHDLGVVLNFRDDPRLEDTNILNPVWVTNGVYQILNDRALMLDHKGILDRSMLSRILDSEQYPKSKQLFIIDMMRKFELCFDLEPDKRFLIPDLLSKEEPDTGEWNNALAFQYHYNILPGSIISRFIVRANQLISRKTYWRSGAVLDHEGSRALVKADREDKKIFIWVTGAEGTRRQLLGIIRSHFDHIHRTITGIEVVGKVPLPGHPDVVVNYRDLLRLETMGEAEWIVPELLTKVNVKQLLDGIEPMRSQQQQNPNNRDPDRTINIENQNIYGSIDNFGNQGISQSVDRSPNSNINAFQGNENQVTQEQLPKEDVIALLTQLTNLIQNSQALDEADQKKVDRYINAAKTEIEEEEEPDKQLIAKNLERTAKTLESASKTVEAGKDLWSQAKPILMTVFQGLGIAARLLTGG